MLFLFVCLSYVLADKGGRLHIEGIEAAEDGVPQPEKHRQRAPCQNEVVHQSRQAQIVGRQGFGEAFEQEDKHNVDGNGQEKETQVIEGSSVVQLESAGMEELLPLPVLNGLPQTGFVVQPRTKKLLCIQHGIN